MACQVTCQNCLPKYHNDYSTSHFQHFQKSHHLQYCVGKIFFKGIKSTFKLSNWNSFEKVMSLCSTPNDENI
jgi:hypothetical protein